MIFNLPHYDGLTPEEREIVMVLTADPQSPSWRANCFSLGYLWFDNERSAEDLAEIGLALAPAMGRTPPGVVSELLMGFGSAREDRKYNEWSDHWRKRVAELGLGAVVLGESLTANVGFGLLLILAGIAASRMRKAKLPAEEKPSS